MCGCNINRKHSSIDSPDKCIVFCFAANSEYDIDIACTLLRDVDNPASHQHIQAKLSTLRQLAFASQ